jgi:hypothetical protein
MSTPETTQQAPTEQQLQTPPPPTRSLQLVLRDALSKGEELRLIVAKGLPDTTQNPYAYMNVEIEGVPMTVPKLAASGLGGTGSGYAVYVLASEDFMLAVGSVSGSATGGGPLTVSQLTVTGTATVGTLQVNGAATVNGNLTVNTNLYVNDVQARDYYGRGMQLTGSGNLSGDLIVGGYMQAARVYAPNGIDARSGSLGFYGAGPVGKQTCSEKYGFDSNTCLTADNIARILRTLGLMNY